MTDDKMLDKVRKLLAKAEKAGSEHEAEAFTAKANELMLKYMIDEAMLQQKGEKSDEKIIAKRVTVEGYAKAKLTLMHSVAQGMGLKSVEYTMTRRGWSTGAGEVMGWESDVAAFDVLFASLQMQAATEAKRELARLKREFPKLRAAWVAWAETRAEMEQSIWSRDAKADTSRMYCPNCKADFRGRAWLDADKTELLCSNCNQAWTPLPRLTWSEKRQIREEFLAENPEPENPGTEAPHGRAFMQSFLIGYANVVGSRLSAQRKEAVKEAEDTRPGVALAVIDRDKAVANAWEKRHPPSSFAKAGRGASNSANAGYYAGRDAGSRANLGQSSVGGGHKAIGR